MYIFLFQYKIFSTTFAKMIHSNPKAPSETALNRHKRDFVTYDCSMKHMSQKTAECTVAIILAI